jgi:hypothetical protein
VRYIEAISEHDMVAVFLRTEIRSDRYAECIRQSLEKYSGNYGLIFAPDTNDPDENAQRLEIMGDFRGYRRNQGLFERFPEELSWYRAALTHDELENVKYIDYSYWNELSGHTRYPVDAVPKIRAGIRIYGESTEGFLELAVALERGACFPELILVGEDESSDWVVLEGHVRLTAYMLAPHCLPAELPVIVGFSPDIRGWPEYSGTVEQA